MAGGIVPPSAGITEIRLRRLKRPTLCIEVADPEKWGLQLRVYPGVDVGRLSGAAALSGGVGRKPAAYAISRPFFVPVMEEIGPEDSRPRQQRGEELPLPCIEPHLVPDPLLAVFRPVSHCSEAKTYRASVQCSPWPRRVWRYVHLVTAGRLVEMPGI